MAKSSGEPPVIGIGLRSAPNQSETAEPKTPAAEEMVEEIVTLDEESSQDAATESTTATPNEASETDAPHSVSENASMNPSGLDFIPPPPKVQLSDSGTAAVATIKTESPLPPEEGELASAVVASSPLSPDAFDAQLAGNPPTKETTPNPASEPVGTEPEEARKLAIDNAPLPSQAEDEPGEAMEVVDEETGEVLELADSKQETSAASSTETPPGTEVVSLKPGSSPEEMKNTGVILSDASVGHSMKANFDIGNLRFCREVAGFGDTKPLTAESIASGRFLLLYAEVYNFSSHEDQGSFVSSFASELCVEKSTGELVHRVAFPDIVDHCETKRHDFFCHYTFALPETVSPGKYVLRLKIKDLDSGDSAERTMDFVVAAPALSKGP
ncbi:MAG: hypothetical protein U1D30_15450 [Planctomycetota bacterium]